MTWLSGPDQAAPQAPRLLRVLAVVMVVVEPLTLALAASAALPRFALYGWPAWALLVLRGAVAAFGIVVGRRLWAGDTAARTLALAWVLLAVTGAVATWLTPYFPSNQTPDGRRFAAALTLGWYAAWTLYLWRVGRTAADTRPPRLDSGRSGT